MNKTNILKELSKLENFILLNRNNNIDTKELLKYKDINNIIEYITKKEELNVIKDGNVFILNKVYIIENI